MGDMRCVTLCQKILEQLGSEVTVTTLEEINTRLIADLFIEITAIKLPETLVKDEDIINRIIEILSSEIIHTTIDHIQAEDVVAMKAEAIEDLLEIYEACLQLKDDFGASSYFSDSRSQLSSQHTMHTNLKSIPSISSSSLSSSKSSLLSVGSSSSSHSPTSSSPYLIEDPSSFFHSTYISKSGCSSMSRFECPDVSTTVDLPCRLCSFIEQKTREGAIRNPTQEVVWSFGKHSDGQEDISKCQKPSKPTLGSRLNVPSKDKCAPGTTRTLPKTRNNVPEKPCNPPVRKLPTGAHNIERVMEGRMRATVELNDMASKASLDYLCLRQQSSHTGGAERRDPPPYDKDVIKERIRPCKQRAPTVSSDDGAPGCREEGGGGELDDIPLISPHMTRVMHKQYQQHLNFLRSHGAGEEGLLRVESQYQQLLDRHTARIAQMRKDLAEQNRVAFLKTQQGVEATVKNLKTHSKSQAVRLAHIELENERLLRAKETKMRQEEERLLKETFMEAMRIEKSLLLELKSKLKEERLREEDKHRIYMDSLENFYKSQLDMLHEALDNEKKTTMIRNGAQVALLRNVRTELQKTLNHELQVLRDSVFESADP